MNFSSHASSAVACLDILVVKNGKLALYNAIASIFAGAGRALLEMSVRLRCRERQDYIFAENVALNKKTL
ncbi:hypothetical protein CPB85DRAFT_1321228 [Mucidula mucida]|nr:hypothetical protein CPB85DRAFT_1321228 [Mucidula mucida]